MMLVAGDDAGRADMAPDRARARDVIADAPLGGELHQQLAVIASVAARRFAGELGGQVLKVAFSAVLSADVIEAPKILGRRASSRLKERAVTTAPFISGLASSAIAPEDLGSGGPRSRWT